MSSYLDKYQDLNDKNIKWERVTAYTLVIAIHASFLLALLMPAKNPEILNVKEDTILINIIKSPPFVSIPIPPPEILKPPPPPKPKPVIRPEPKPVVKQPPKPAPKRVATPTSSAPVIFDDATAMDTYESPSPPARAVAPPAPPASNTGSSRGGSGGIDGLVATVSPTPPYPPSALRSGATGTVILEIFVGPDGRPTKVNIKKSSGNKDLDRTASSFVKRSWRFQATGVEQIGILPVEFKL